MADAHAAAGHHYGLTTTNMTYSTATEEGRMKRLEEFVDDAKKRGNIRALVRLIGGSAEDFAEYNGASHPDEKLRNNN